MEKLKKVLEELNPYVVVVGSYARGEQHGGSDIDMYIRSRTEDELDEDYFNELEEDYIDKAIEILTKNNVTWDSLLVDYVHTESLPVQLELSGLFKIPMHQELKVIEVFGVNMLSAVDDKAMTGERKRIEGTWEDWRVSKCTE